MSFSSLFFFFLFFSPVGYLTSLLRYWVIEHFQSAFCVWSLQFTGIDRNPLPRHPFDGADIYQDLEVAQGINFELFLAEKRTFFFLSLFEFGLEAFLILNLKYV